MASLDTLLNLIVSHFARICEGPCRGCSKDAPELISLHEGREGRAKLQLLAFIVGLIIDEVMSDACGRA